MIRPVSSWAFAVLALVCLSACRPAPPVRRAESFPAELAPYLYGWTSGILSRTDPVRVRFAVPLCPAGQVGAPAPDALLRFEPPMDGMASWEDPQTIRFDPETPWESGRLYLATVRLDPLLPQLPSALRAFEFDFLVREQDMHLHLDGLSAVDFSDLQRQRLTGRVTLQDVPDEGLPEGCLAVRQDGRTLPVRWSAGPGATGFTFTVDSIRRTSTPGRVDIELDGAVFGIRRKMKQELMVPALGDFSVQSVAWQAADGQGLVVLFSDPLAPAQDLRGLFGFFGESGYGPDDPDTSLPALQPEYLIDGNRLVLFPPMPPDGALRLELRPGIRNRLGVSIPGVSTWDVGLPVPKPAVRLQDNGVLMPSAGGDQFLFFEAVHLQAVEVEVFKIFHQNIHQFLQTNELDGVGDYALDRVGKIIRREEIPLSRLSADWDPKVWNRYALDLGALFRADPTAIYQVRIGFRPTHALIECPAAPAAGSPVVPRRSTASDAGERPSLLSDFYGIEGYYEGFRWDHREDPCFPGYYHPERFVQANILMADIGLTAKAADDGSWWVAATDIRSAGPMPSVTLRFYDYQQELVGQAQTNAEGMANLQLDRQPFLLVAGDGQKQGFLKLGDGNARNLSRFDVSGEGSPGEVKGFLYGNSGVWRPGDSLFLHFVLHDPEGTLPPGYPLVFELEDALGRRYDSRLLSDPVGNIYPIPIGTDPSDPTGNWTATVRVGAAVIEKTLKIETVKPNRLRISLDTGKRALAAAAEPFSCRVQVDWLHGAPGSQLPVAVEATPVPVRTDFRGYGGFVFDDPSRKQVDAAPSLLFEGQTDDSGKALFTKTLLPVGGAYPGKLELKFRVRAFERGGDISTFHFRYPYDPYERYVGIRVPTVRGEKRVAAGGKVPLKMASLRADGRPAAGIELEAALYKVDWRWWWDATDEGDAAFTSDVHEHALVRTRLQTDGNGLAAWDAPVSDWGRYLIRVCDPATGHCSGDYFYAGYPWDAPGGSLAVRQEAAMMTFTTERPGYSVGEDIEVNIPSGGKGRMFVSLENGHRVIRSFWRDVSAGENKFRIRAIPDMCPNFYIHVSLFQPYDQQANDLPIRMYGVLPVSVTDPATRLEPLLTVPREVRPGASFQVKVSEKSGSPMAYTLAVMDEGVLGLTDFRTPDPHPAIYAREALGVRTWDMYDYVLGAAKERTNRILRVGGDGETVIPAERRNANRFQPVVLHAGPFFLDGGESIHRFTMPAHVGTVRVMLTAAHPDGAYGAVDRTLAVRQPLMVLATAPRKLGPGETFRVPVSVFNMESAEQEVTVTLRVDAKLLSPVSELTRKVKVGGRAERLVWFSLRSAESAEGTASLLVSAGNGQESARHEIRLTVENPNPVVRSVYSGVLAAGRSWTQACPPVGKGSDGQVVLEVSSFPALQLSSRLDYLIRYPHGCLEQVTSAAFPQLYLADMTELSAPQEAYVRSYLTQAIRKLSAYQLPGGGFAYWPGSDYHPWSTNYAGHLLLEAEQAGYPVPASVRSKWMTFQQAMARRWTPLVRGAGPEDAAVLEQAYRLYTLVLAGKPEWGAMNRLRELPDLSAEAAGRLAAAYAKAGKTAIGRQLVREVDDPGRHGHEPGGPTLESALRDEAMRLETQLLLGQLPEAQATAQYLAEALGGTEWFDTHATAYALLAIGKFVRQAGLTTSAEARFRYVDGEGRTHSVKSDAPVFRSEWKSGPGNRPVTVVNEGTGTLFTRLIVAGKPEPVQGGKTVAENLSLKITFESPDGTPLDPDRLPQGTDFQVLVQVTHPKATGRAYQGLALTFPFPAGWELVNERLSEPGTGLPTHPPHYQDIRDDRVLTYFDLAPGAGAVFRFRMTAAYQGTFFQPVISCQAMYDASVQASVPGRWVSVIPPAGIPEAIPLPAPDLSSR